MRVFCEYVHSCGDDWKPEENLGSSGAGRTERLGIGAGHLLRFSRRAGSALKLEPSLINLSYSVKRISQGSSRITGKRFYMESNADFSYVSFIL